jgi:hypothetical protein
MRREVGPVKRRGLNELQGEQRANLDGKPAEDLTFESWLMRQSPQRQLQILGAARLKLFRSGKASIADMVSATGRPLSIDALLAKVG